MNILAVETSCDETALAIISYNQDTQEVSALSHVVLSQAQKHAEFGGVFPSLAKREHAKNIVPVLEQALTEADLLQEGATSHDELNLEREPELQTALENFFKTHEKPAIDHIVVTSGPGLEPALWVGINFAKTLGTVWNVPVTPVNHMEGHVLSVLAPAKDQKTFTLKDFSYPVLSLLVSGGHTELVLLQAPGKYERIGATQDDAAGEAFDKAARILGLPYPGGPEVGKLALQGVPNDEISLPRPMLHTPNYNFSFSGLKTAVLYLVQNLGGLENISEQTRADIAKEFQDAVIEVLVKKTMRALDEYGATGLIVAGGVSANRLLRDTLTKEVEERGAEIFLPAPGLSTDNALMIALAGVQHLEHIPEDIQATGNWKL